MNVAMILAGGSGQRMGASIPKQFIKVQDKPLIVHTLEKVQKHDDIDAIQIVCVKDHLDYVKELSDEYGITKLKWVIPGGQTFMQSVRNGVYALHGVCSPEDVIMIHMSVAPFIEEDIITDAIAVCKKHGNSIAMNPCLLCMGEYTAPEYTEKSVLRETLVGLNTPQTFHFGQLYDTFQRGDADGVTDRLEPHLTSLMYEYGVRMYFSKSAQSNIKITTQEDLDLFSGYLIAKQLQKKKNDIKGD